jgi:hypothetical protein
MSDTNASSSYTHRIYDTIIIQDGKVGVGAGVATKPTQTLTVAGNVSVQDLTVKSLTQASESGASKPQ